MAAPAYVIWGSSGIGGCLLPGMDLIATEAENYNLRRNECHGWGGLDFKRCNYGGTDIKAILVGDSHASAVATVVAKALPNETDALLTFT